MSESVIVNKSFEGSEVQRLLAKFYKVRLADGTVKHSIIFPKSCKAFLIQPICEITTVWPPRGKYFMDQSTLERIDSFLRIHRNAFVFLSSGSMQNEEIYVMDAVQKQFRNESVVFLPTTGAAQCISIMMDILKPKSDKIKQRILDAKRLSEGKFNEVDICKIMENNLNVSSHDAMVIQDGCQTITNISSATQYQLMECSLSAQAAKEVVAYFQRDQ